VIERRCAAPVNLSVMRMIEFSWRRLGLGTLAIAACISVSACSKVKYRVHEILKPPVTWTGAYRHGTSEAKTDLAAGLLRYRTYGMPTVWDGPDLYAQHLRSGYNIELVTVAGCVVTEDLVNRTRGYNETAVPVIEARYGKGILDRARQEAIEEWKQTHRSK
jgi:hypothetical protein